MERMIEDCLMVLLTFGLFVFYRKGAVDILINNAALISNNTQTTEDGIRLVVVLVLMLIFLRFILTTPPHF